MALVAWGGWDFAEEVILGYPNAIDGGFRDRLRFMTRLLSVMWLALAHERDSDAAKHVGGVRNAFATETSS